MSAYQKYNNLLKHHTPAEVAAKIGKNFGPHGPPEVMFNKLDPALRECLIAMSLTKYTNVAPYLSKTMRKKVAQKVCCVSLFSTFWNHKNMCGTI